MNKAEPITQSPILKAVGKIENQSIRDFLATNDLRGEMEHVMKGFFNKERLVLPENPYPELTKRFRQIEVRYDIAP